MYQLMCDLPNMYHKCDRDNIDSLATALADLVNGAEEGGSGDSVGGNFQLIVITHDDDLISSLGRAVNDQNFYYKVSRNDRMLSVIKKYKVDDL